jgi:hypothetical protein
MLLQLLSVLAGVASAAPAPANIYHGRLNQLAVEIPKLRDDIDVDGRLSEPAWAGAAMLTGFSQYRPVDGLPASDSTEVLVWYDDHAIYFGIRAFEPHGVVNATLADRDRIGSDDFIQILLDTFSDRRRALLFAVNPLGVQSDGVFNEGAGDHLTDLSPDFIFDSRGHVTAAGFEVELRIPFKSIRYQSGRVQSWGINIVRGVQHSGHEQTWTPARRGETSFLAQAGTLLDLTDLKRGIVLDVNPVITAKADGRYAAPGDWSYDAGAPEFGGNLRWGATENLTLNATINPDFSQVESDAGQAVYDPRQALFFPEKRPFFLEGSEVFQVPSQLVYTRRIGSPLAAAKFTGKASGTSIGVISAVDDDVFSWTGEHRPVVNILRLSRDVGASSTAGLVYTDRIDGDWYNRVAAVDTRIVLGRSYSVSLQGGASFTRVPGSSAAGAPVFQVNASRRGRAFNLGFFAGGSHPDFRADAGFVSRPGIVRANLRPTYTVYGAPGATIESWTGGITLDGTYRYQRFVDAGAPDDQKAHFSTALVLRGGWRLGAAFLLESFKYPPELYADYWIDLGSDTMPYVGTNRITNYDVQVNVGTPQFRTFSANGFIIAGRDENFEEWAPAWIVISTLNADWRPDERVRVEGSYVHQRYHRTDDRSLVAFRQIPRLKLEYQLSRPLFLRLVGEYDARMRDDLRDNSRTDRPILFCDAGPVDCIPARGFERGAFRGDFLFSYQPSPGTVLFAGYASTLTGDDGYAMRDLRRVNDGFFLKLSYLFRL